MEKEEEDPLPINEKEVMDYYGFYILSHIHLLIQDLQ